MRANLSTAWLVASLALAGAAACGDGGGGSAAPAAPAAAPAAAPKPKPKPVEDAGVSIGGDAARLEYTYNPLTKRDPFRGIFTANVTQTTSGNPNAQATDPCDEPLCKFDLEELTLVAVVSGDANPMGMLEDRTGQGHLVRRNSRVGKNGGKVTAISRNCLTVTSYFQGPDGKAKPNRVETCVKVDERMRDPLDLMKNKVD